MNLKCKTALALSAMISSGLPISAGAVNWNWQYFGPYDENIGVPRNMISLKNDIPPTLLADVFKILPEKKDIKTNNPNLITDDLGANLYFVENAEVSVAFLEEGAGYRNSVGFFMFDPKSKPATANPLYDPATRTFHNQKILFPNFSKTGSGGALNPGDGLYLGKFKAGQAMGFTIVSNGYSKNTTKNFPTEVNPNQSEDTVFYSIRSWNPEAPSGNMNAHTVLLSAPASGVLALGFEDQNRTAKSPTSDHDFNDVILLIKVTPDTAIDRSRINALNNVQDTDGDGVPDALDVYPKDPARAFRNFYPSATGTGFGYLAFEDNWPQTGDYDMNDLVVGYRVIEVLNAKREVTDLKLTYRFSARGAAFKNGFGVHFPGVPASNVRLTASDAPEPTNIILNDGIPQKLSPEAEQADAVFIIAPNVNTLTPAPEGCIFFNTEPNCPKANTIADIVANIQFVTPVAKLGTAPYNPFIYINGVRDKEVHLVDHPPTAKSDSSLFGQGIDDSRPAQGRYYRSQKNIPWAIELPEDWKYPAERKDLGMAYHSFTGWVQSGGINDKDWYLRNINQSLIIK
jgi:LruC domain-containing protein